MSDVATYIRAISCFLPPKKFTNQDYFERFPEALNDKNLHRIGIESRQHVAANVTASDLAVEAAEKLFASGEVDRSEIDFVLFCAQEFDHYTPSTACLIQQRLGLSTHIGALDFNLGCSGFVYGLSLAKGLIEAVGVKNVLLLTSSTQTKMLHEGDKSLWFVFGDGAAATVVSSRSEKGVGPFVFGTEGSDKIIVRDGGARNPINEKSSLPETDAYGTVTSRETVNMNGTGIFVFGMKVVPKMIKELLEKANLKLADIDCFVFHQANGFMIESIRKKVGIPEEKFIVCLKNVGNTVSSTIPIALLEAEKEGKIKRGDKVLLAAFGTGLSWSGTVMDW